jgi:RNA polymerase sigma factor (sigma-70 family)
VAHTISAERQVNQPSQGSSDAEGPIGDLLAQLTSDRPDSGWNEFLKRFSPLILHVARQYESNDGRATDCFLYACGQLSDNGFRRLLSFRPNGPARFRTWLTAVVANLCIDWRRKQHGRFRPIAAVAGLPELEKLVYRNIYVRGMTREQCLRALNAKFPSLTELRLSEINAALFSLLTSRQRWQLSFRTRGSVSLDELSPPDHEQATIEPQEPGPGPEALAQTEQERTTLEAAMSRLPPRLRLLLRLRYQQDLTLEEIARLTRLSDPYRANREIQAALAALAQLVKALDPLS